MKSKVTKRRSKDRTLMRRRKMSQGAEISEKLSMGGQSFVLLGGNLWLEDLRVSVVLGKAKLCRMWSWEWNNNVEWRQRSLEMKCVKKVRSQGLSLVGCLPQFYLFSKLEMGAVQRALMILLQHHGSKALILLLWSFLCGPNLISIRDYWKIHSFN